MSEQKDWIVNRVAIGVFIVFSLILLTSGAFGYECYSGGTGAFAWYTLDDAQDSGDTAIDICGYANGTEINNPTESQAGVFGESYRFTNANNDYIKADAGVPFGDASEGSVNIWGNIADWSGVGDKYLFPYVIMVSDDK